MADYHGDFIWYELMTTDADAAQAFYSGLAGWSFEKMQGDGPEYQVFSADGPPVGGLLSLTPEMQAGGARPLWAGYVGVDDVDAITKKIDSAGGEVLMQPQDIPGVGRFAFVQDPQGVPFYIMRGESDEPSESFAQEAPREGHCAWNELSTADPAAALGFYENLFGWEKADSMDMGEMGAYDMLRNPPQQNMLGAMMKKPEEMPISLWLYYFRVPDIDKAVSFIGEHGGQVINGPMEIPGGEFALNGIDPQGALFALIGKRQ